MELNYTKFFDVKSPVGINETESKTSYNSIGVDLYMPKISAEFIAALVASNKHSKLVDHGNYPNFEIVCLKTGNILLKYDDNDKFYRIYKDMQIPMGVGFMIPIDYYMLITSKSSSFNLGFTVVDGKIDEDYTYGIGLQLVKLNSDVLMLKSNQKVAQVLLKKGYKIEKFNEIKLIDWVKNSSIKERRLSRSGGFGSTGKF